MKETPKENRVLALDIRPRRLGFVALNVSQRLDDYGTRKIRSPLFGIAKVGTLIHALLPSVIVLRKIPRWSTRNRRPTRILQHLICGLARQYRTEVAFVTESALSRHFRLLGQCTKYQIASYLAEEFGDLAWKLPRKRKSYEREPWSLVIFDAAALAVAYIAKQNHDRSHGVMEAELK